MSISFVVRSALTGFAALAATTCLAAQLPDPVAPAMSASPDGATSHSEKTVLAGGCFWGMQAVFEHVKGVSHVTAGYAGGSPDTAEYETVSTGRTGHAESVEVTYDPAQVSFGQLLKVYFGVAHNPTQLNRQDPDEGTQYRSEIFFTTPDQEATAKAYIAQLDAAKAFPKPIVTQVAPLKGFYPAEAYHQDYAQLHPHQPYIAIYDLPKVADLRKEMPALYAEAPTN
jgi:peptide-methionine (S)-S-oxide reductase